MRLKTLLIAVTLLAFIVLCVNLLITADKTQKIDKLDIQSKSIDLKAQQLKGEELLKKLDIELNKDVKDQERIKQLEEENIKYQQESEQLKKDLQVRAAEKKRLASLSVTKKAYAAEMPSKQGSCTEWMAQAGIPLTVATQKLILNESGCRTTARNPTSGACGIPQAYPCSKLPCPLNDSGAVCQLTWMNGYVKDRYGTWENALSMWHSRCGSTAGCWY